MKQESLGNQEMRDKIKEAGEKMVKREGREKYGKLA